MVIALLAVLGVDLIVIRRVRARRKRWVNRQPNVFRGVIRVGSGEVDGLRPKWSRGYGRWVRDVLIWTKAPFLFRNQILAADGLEERRPARPDEVKRLGDHPVVVQVRVGSSTVEVAANGDHIDLLLGPYRKPVGNTVGAEPTRPAP